MHGTNFLSTGTTNPLAWEWELDAFSPADSFGLLRQDRAELIAEIFALLNPSGSGLPAAGVDVSLILFLPFFALADPKF